MHTQKVNMQLYLCPFAITPHLGITDRSKHAQKKKHRTIHTHHHILINKHVTNSKHTKRIYLWRPFAMYVRILQHLVALCANHIQHQRHAQMLAWYQENKINYKEEFCCWKIAHALVLFLITLCFCACMRVFVDARAQVNEINECIVTYHIPPEV